MESCRNLTLAVVVIDHYSLRVIEVGAGKNKTLLGSHGKDLQLLNILSQILRFKYYLLTPSDKKWGSCDLNLESNCSGLIGLIARKEGDMAISTVTPTVERNRFVDFSFPYGYDEIAFVTKEPPALNSTNELFFTEPFQAQETLKINLNCKKIREKIQEYVELWHPVIMNVWLFLSSLLLILVIIIKIMQRGKLMESKRFGLEQIIALLLRQSVSLKPLMIRRVSWMVIFTLIAFAGFAAKIYECMLTSSASAAPVSRPIDTVLDMVDAVINDNYVISAREDTSDQRMITSSENIAFKLFAASTSNWELPKSLQEGMLMVLEMDKYAFVAPRIGLKSKSVEMNLPLSKFHIASETLFNDLVSIVFRPGFPCKKAVDYWILHLSSSGLLSKWETNDTKLSRKPPMERQYMEIKYFTLSDLRLIFLGLIACWIIALSILTLETIISVSSMV